MTSRQKNVLLVCAILILSAGFGLLYYILQRGQPKDSPPQELNSLPAETSAPIEKGSPVQAAQAAIINGFFKDLSKGQKGESYLCGGRSTKSQYNVKKWTIERNAIKMNEDGSGEYIVKVDYSTKENSQRTARWHVLVTKKEEAEKEYCIALFFEIEQ